VSNPSAWLTPDSIPTETVCLPLVIPDDEGIIAAVVGAIVPLIYSSNWEPFGTVTPAAIAARMAVMYGQLISESCGAAMQIDLFRHELAQGTAGGGITLNTDTVVPYNVTDGENEGNISLATNIFTIEPGRYHIRLEHILRTDAAHADKCWIADSASGAILKEGLTYLSPSLVYSLLVAEMTLNTEFSYAVKFMCRTNDTRVTDAFGVAANVAGHVEVYGLAKFTRISDFVP